MMTIGLGVTVSSYVVDPARLRDGPVNCISFVLEWVR